MALYPSVCAPPPPRRGRRTAFRRPGATGGPRRRTRVPFRRRNRPAPPARSSWQSCVARARSRLDSARRTGGAVPGRPKDRERPHARRRACARRGATLRSRARPKTPRPCPGTRPATMRPLRCPCNAPPGHGRKTIRPAHRPARAMSAGHVIRRSVRGSRTKRRVERAPCACGSTVPSGGGSTVSPSARGIH